MFDSSGWNVTVGGGNWGGSFGTYGGGGYYNPNGGVYGGTAMLSTMNPQTSQLLMLGLIVAAAYILTRG